MRNTVKEETYLELRNKTVVKANELIQKSRFNLSLQQQKVVLYLISQIQPTDTEFKLYEFNINEFCKVCGIDNTSGKNYADLKQAIKDIAQKVLWITLPNGKDATIRWIEKAYIDSKRGMIEIRLDEDMKPFLLQLKDNFTAYEIIYTLHFKSKYTIRLYELIKSIHFHELRQYERTFQIDELKRMLGAETYTLYKNFKLRVLTPSVNEINEYSDKTLSFIENKKGNKVVSITFTIGSKDVLERTIIRSKIQEELDGNQISVWEYIDNE